MKHPSPEKQQYAMNLTNGSKEAVERVNQWVQEKGGSVEHLSTEQIRSEVLPRLDKK